MNGREIEQLLTLIDQNVAHTATQLDEEVIEYVKRNEGAVLASLSRDGQVDVPTSLGSIRLQLNDLQANAA